MNRQHKTRTPRFRILLFLSISLLTVLLLVGGTELLQHRLTLPALAQTTAPTCASTEGKQPELCEHQDPITQGCVADAETIEIDDVLYQGRKIAELNLRSSARCGTFWVRTIAYANELKHIRLVHAMLPNQTKENIEDIRLSPGSVEPGTDAVVYTDMVRVLNAPTGEAVIEIIGEKEPPGIFSHL